VLERDLSLEKMLPVHDLRPAYAQLRSRLQALQERLAALGPEAQGAGHYALAQGRFLLGDWPGARLELERAGASGFRGPELAGLLAQTLAAGQDRKEKAAQFQGTAVAAPAGQVADLVRQNPASGDYGEAMVAYLSKDYARAFELARAAGRAQPWQSAADALAAQSLTALGRQGIDRDDFLLAEARFGTAMEVARDRLQRDPSDESMHHAYLLAACGLASLRLERGRLAAAFLARLRQDSETALRLNPGNPELQDDRLAVGILQARRLAQRGADPGPELDAALRFMAAWTREPLDAELRADRMLIHWLRAERAFSQGRDPEPALAQALLDPGHTPFLGRDYLGAVLNFKAQVEAARGRDPRPTLDQAMAGLEPLLGQGAPGFLCATAAQSWLIRGRWEAAHGLDASPSLRRARELAERGRGRRPRNLVAFLE